jgi:pyruvate formate lyase activating enzyme
MPETQLLGEAPRGETSPHLPIYSLTPFTMLDFPERTACIVWFSGCNMRCPYCHNPQIVKGKGYKNIQDILDFLEKRQGLLDGVVLSGGEATLYASLLDFVRVVKKMGYAIKLDTNGTRPEMIRSFLDESLLNYISLDYKAPLKRFKRVSGVNTQFENFSQTLDLLCGQSFIDFEVRTTVHTDLMDEFDLNSIIADLEHRNYRGIYYIQNFRSDNDRPTLGNFLLKHACSSKKNFLLPRTFGLNFVTSEIQSKIKYQQSRIVFSNFR